MSANPLRFTKTSEGHDFPISLGAVPATPRQLSPSPPPDIVKLHGIKPSSPARPLLLPTAYSLLPESS